MSLTSQQIVSLACQVAKCPGYVQQAGQLLNMILSDLCQTYDLEVAKGKVNFNFVTTGSGPNYLPADWLRANRDDVYYTINGVPVVMVNYENAEFDQQIQQAGLTAYPSMYTVVTDSTGVNPPAMYVWPPPSGAYPVTVRYQRQMPDITTPETSSVVPWFPNTTYLKTRLAGELMQITDDDRSNIFLGNGDNGAQGILGRYLKLQGDDEDRAKRVTLDRRYFGKGNYAALPNTKYAGW